MAFTNTQSKEVNCKILYFGANGAGKLTSLRSIYKQSSLDYSSSIIDAQDRQPRWFSFLPLSLTNINGFQVKLHLYTANWNEIPKDSYFSLFQGLDGIIFVVDSRIEALGANIEALQNLKSWMRMEDKNLYDMPIVVQYNKQDLADIVDLSILSSELNIFDAQEFNTVATKSQGTMECLKGLAKIIISKLSI